MLGLLKWFEDRLGCSAPAAPPDPPARQLLSPARSLEFGMNCLEILIFKGRNMLGLCAMLLGFGALSCVGMYIISWEIQHKEKRPTFAAKFWTDCAALFGGNRQAEAGVGRSLQGNVRHTV